MSFAVARTRLHTAVFDRLGEAVTWNGVEVRARVSTPDQMADWAGGPRTVPTASFKVRASEVPEPSTGDTVVRRGRTYEIIGAPVRDRSGEVWTCEAEEVE